MKKSIRKLALRSETVRALRPLNFDEVAHVRGGDGEAPRYESTGSCPGRAAGLLATEACG
jgi:hypothetical protein